MKYSKSIYSVLLSALLLLSCVDADDTIGLEESTAGAYVTVLSVTSQNFMLVRLQIHISSSRSGSGMSNREPC